MMNGAMSQVEFHLLKTAFSIAVAVMLSPVAYSSSYSPQREINTSSLAISPDGRTAAASSSDRPYVVIYDLQVQKTRGVVHDFITPRSVLFDRSGRYLYVADSTLGVVKKIDSASLQTVSVFLPITGAFEAALSSNGQTLYVSNEGASLLIGFDLPSGRETSRVTAYSEPQQTMRAMSDGTLLYVIDFWNDKVIVVDTAANQFEDVISGFDQIRSIAVTRDGTTLYAANSGANTVAVVDLKSRSITREISVGNDPRAVTLSPDERFLYSSNLDDNTISVIDTSSRQVTATICDLVKPAQAIAFSAERAALYALDTDLNISRLDSTTKSFVYTIPPQAAMEAAGCHSIHLDSLDAMRGVVFGQGREPRSVPGGNTPQLCGAARCHIAKASQLPSGFPTSHLEDSLRNQRRLRRRPDLAD